MLFVLSQAWDKEKFLIMKNRPKTFGFRAPLPNHWAYGEQGPLRSSCEWSCTKGKTFYLKGVSNEFKPINFILPWICSRIDQRERQNVIRKSMTRSAAPRETLVTCFCTSWDTCHVLLLVLVIKPRKRHNVVRTLMKHSAAPRVPLPCSYHIFTSSVIYYCIDPWQHEVYIFLRDEKALCSW